MMVQNTTIGLTIFDQGKNILSYLPLYPVRGNHERDHPFFHYLNYP